MKDFVLLFWEMENEKKPFPWGTQRSRPIPLPQVANHTKLDPLTPPGHTCSIASTTCCSASTACCSLRPFSGRHAAGAQPSAVACRTSSGVAGRGHAWARGGRGGSDDLDSQNQRLLLNVASGPHGLTQCPQGGAYFLENPPITTPPRPTPTPRRRQNPLDFFFS